MRRERAVELNIASAPRAGDDGFGPWGGIDSQGNPVASGTYTTASFAEWAIDLRTLFGGQSLCGQKLFVTGVSRASTGQVGALTESAALKDVVGPKLYSFGGITATAALTGSCELSFGYSAGALDVDGVTPLPASQLSCAWRCAAANGDPVTLGNPNACAGTGTVVRGDGSPHTIICTATVNLTGAPAACADAADASTVVFAPIRVSIAPNPATLTCAVPGTPGSDAGNIGPAVTFSPTVSGGDGNYMRAWHVSGPNAATCLADAGTCRVDIPDSDFCALTTVSVTVDDGTPLCPAATSEVEAVTKQTMVSATNR